MTPEQAKRASERTKEEEEKFQENLKRYLEENPFPKGDYSAQEGAYKKMVERLLRLEKNFNNHSHNMKY